MFMQTYGSTGLGEIKLHAVQFVMIALGPFSQKRVMSVNVWGQTNSPKSHLNSQIVVAYVQRL